MTPQNDVMVGTALAPFSIENALARYEVALSKDPNFAPALWSRCFLKLMQGDLSYWAEYEWFDNPKYNSNDVGWYRRRCKKPLWDGTELNNKKIFLYCDEGFGDFFQFARYVQLVKNMGSYTILEALPDTYELCRTIPGIDQIVHWGQDDTVEYDLHCPLMYAPVFFDIKNNYIPNNVPYFSNPNVNGMNRINIDLMFEMQNDGINVGVVWQGNPKHKEDLKRSISYTLYKKLANKCNLYGLQKGVFGDGMINLGMMLVDWSDTANAISHMDLIITVDTSVAHLAGAMGKEVWLLIPKFPDWRWGLGSTKTPWYPSVKIFRQTTTWDEVLQRIYDLM